MTASLATRMAGGRRIACWLTYGIFIAQLGGGIPAPLYPDYQRRWGLSPTDLTSLFVALVLGIVIGLVAVGWTVGRVGGGSTIRLGAGCALTAAAAFGSADYAWVVAIGSLLQGIAIGVITGLAPVQMNDLGIPGGGRTVGRLVTGGTAAGLAVGPLWSGALLQFAPWPGRLVFVLQGVLVLPLFVLRLPGLRSGTNSVAGTRPGVTRATLSSSEHTAFLVACAVGFCAFGLGGFFSSLSPLVTKTLLGVDNKLILGSVVSVFFIANSAAQCALFRVSLLTALRVGAFLVALGLFLVALAPWTGGLGLFLTGTVLSGAGQGIAIAAATAVASELRPDQRGGKIAAVFFIVCYFGTAAWALGTGAFATQTSLSVALVAFCSLIGALMLGLAIGRGRKFVYPRES